MPVPITGSLMGTLCFAHPTLKSVPFHPNPSLRLQLVVTSPERDRKQSNRTNSLQNPFST